MIDLDNGYHIDADNYNFILYKDGALDKNGKPLKVNMTFHPSLANALQRYLRTLELDAVRGRHLSLLDAVATFTAFTSATNYLIGQIKDIETYQITPPGYGEGRGQEDVRDGDDIG